MNWRMKMVKRWLAIVIRALTLDGIVGLVDTSADAKITMTAMYITVGKDTYLTRCLWYVNEFQWAYSDVQTL